MAALREAVMETEGPEVLGPTSKSIPGWCRLLAAPVYTGQAQGSPGGTGISGLLS